MKLLVVAIFLVVFSVSESAARLQVRGKDLVYNGQKVFLSGANLAWDNYGNDWGSGKYFNHRSMYQGYFKEIADNGGNVVRIWVNFEGWNGTPKWDGNGNVVGTDEKNQLLSEMSAVLDDAAAHNIFVIFSLWNGKSFRLNFIIRSRDSGQIKITISNASQ
jgi:mannan endo-1,4-beta-mannosidase